MAVWNFTAELDRYGPRANVKPMTLAQAKSYCAYVTNNHYENFSVVSWLLPRRLLVHFQAIYAYCRWSDDLADETGSRDTALALLDWWRQELDRCFAGKTTHPVFVALQPTLQRFHLEPIWFHRLLDAFVQDQQLQHYRSFEQLLGYCQNSADPVGRLVLSLFECHTPDTGQYSDAICTALQLANFWQDVARDYKIGRVYLPEEDRRQFGVTLEELGGASATLQFQELLRFEVERTRQYFQTGSQLLPMLPQAMRDNIELFYQGGLAILQAIQAQNYDVLQVRPTVTKTQKLRLIGGVLWRRLYRWP